MPDSDELIPVDQHPWVAECLKQTRFGVSIFPQPPDWSHFVDLVQRMEAGGVDAYFAYDHPGANTDCWTSLAGLAVSTSSIRLGTAVDCIYYRSPYLLARQAADVDRMSKGRLILGLGIGHVADEFQEMGLPFLPLGKRQLGLDETIAILKGLWSGMPFHFQGELFEVDSPGTFLPPVQQPRIPLLIAGGGEKVTLRQVGQYADASNMGAHSSIGGANSDADVRRKMMVLDGYCQQFGRTPESVLRTQFTMPLILGRSETDLASKMSRLTAQYGQEKIDWCGEALIAATTEKAVAYYRQMTDLGFQYFIANILEGDDDTIDLLIADVMPAFKSD